MNNQPCLYYRAVESLTNVLRSAVISVITIHNSDSDKSTSTSTWSQTILIFQK